MLLQEVTTHVCGVPKAARMELVFQCCAVDPVVVSSMPRGGHLMSGGPLVPPYRVRPA